MQFTTVDKVYRNDGNPGVVALVDRSAVDILDVGCGAGGNAALLRHGRPDRRIYGITGSAAEGDVAAPHLDRHWVVDLEHGLPAELDDLRFDCILFSHVLEHVRDPATLLARLAARLTPGGTCVIALPNILYWRERLDFLRGRFEYRDSGALDATHLRFFTHRTAPRLLFGAAPQLVVDRRTVTGNVPLSILRRHVLPRRLSSGIDRWACARFPNLFGAELLLRARASDPGHPR